MFFHDQTQKRNMTFKSPILSTELYFFLTDYEEKSILVEVFPVKGPKLNPAKDLNLEAFLTIF